MKNQARPPVRAITPQFKRDMVQARVKDFLSQVAKELDRAQTWLISAANVLDAGGTAQQSLDHLAHANSIIADAIPYSAAATAALKELTGAAGHPDPGAQAAHPG